MKHLETFNHWYDKLLNNWPFLIDDTSVESLGIAWGFKENGKWVFTPRLTGNAHQFFNAIFFIRVVFPLGLFIQIRWSDKPTGKQFIQLGLGYKNTGRFAILCRVQSDASSAVGYHPGLPNNGQAQGFEYGGH